MDETELLVRALLEWGGPAHSTEEFAIAMGFMNTSDLLEQCRRIRSALKEGTPLTPIDWARTLLAAEIVFISDVVGSGYEWTTSTGYGDIETIKMLRSIQRKLVRVVSPVIGAGLGTRV
jgi:hypothetical protein